ncbi:uncharacterized protein LOC123505071 isoform X1 [Portunus trituberculatus]|uniref:uncharacterized protein LOC123505071 isoform X1 n=1 Tax=Portunus trituberculatus TaxID=210409 RepID=UPI001E1CB28C|nr:uncharacterized protein LOC123505071 isoform X1 [Portunus trituberculatus]
MSGLSQIMQLLARSTAAGILPSDTGCNCMIVSEKAVPLADETSLMNSKAPSSLLQTSVSDLAMLRSSQPTASSLPASEEELPLMRAYAVETRSSRMERVHPLVLLELQPLDVTPEDFACLQEECPSLGHKVNTGEEEWTKDGSSLLPSLLPSLYRTLKPPAKVEWRLIWLDHCLSHPQKATGTYSL